LQTHSQNCEEQLLALSYFCTSVRLSFRMEFLGYHWTDFHEIRYLRVFLKIC